MANISNPNFFQTADASGEGHSNIVTSALALSAKLQHPTRASLAAAETAGDYASAPDGFLIFAGGVIHERLSGATVNPGLPNWIPAGMITPEHFADNTNPDVTDMTAAIQSAVDYAGSQNFVYASPVSQASKADSNGVPVLFRYVYRTENTITVRQSGISLLGWSDSSSEIRHYGDNTLFDIRDADEFNNGSIQNIKIANLKFRGRFVNPTASTALDIGVVKHVRIHACRFNGFYNDVDFVGTTEPVIVSDCNFFANNGVSGNTGDGGGNIIRILPALVDSASQNRTNNVADPDDATAFYAVPSMIYFDNCEFRNGMDAKSKMFNITAIDGLYVSNCHLLNANDDMVLINQQSSVVPVANVHFDGVFFDGINAATEQVINIAAPGFASPSTFPIKMRYDGCKFNGAGSAGEVGTSLVRCASPHVNTLIIHGGEMDSCAGNFWCNITAGGEYLEISNVEFIGDGISTTAAYILLNNGTAQADMFDKVKISGNTFRSIGTNPSTHNIRIAGNGNDVIISDNQYEPASSASGDGLTFNTSNGSVAGWTANTGTPTRNNIAWGATG